jgi:hypothetical protein
MNKRAHNKEIKVRPGGGESTSSKIDGFDQLPYNAMLRMAARYSLGEEKHGRHNWRKSLSNKVYVINRLGHVIKHALKAIAIIEGFIDDDGDDNAAAIMWGGALLAESQELQRNKKRPENDASKLLP